MRLALEGTFVVRCFHEDGSLAWEEEVNNSPTLAGLTYLLGAAFNSVSQLASWYLGLVDNANFTAFSTADVMSSHAGWVEVTAYSLATRPQWAPLSVASGVIINSSVVSFVVTASKTLKGLFVVSNSTKSGTSGTLWATAPFSVTRDVVVNQSFQIYYRVRGTGGS